jgi:hypothetical protein
VVREAVARLETLEVASSPASRHAEDAVVSPSPRPQLGALEPMTDLEQADCGPPGCVYLRAAGEVGDAVNGLENREVAPSPASRHAEDAVVSPSGPQLETVQHVQPMTDLEQADCVPPDCVHLRRAGEVGETVTRLEKREVASLPASRHGTARKLERGSLNQLPFIASLAQRRSGPHKSEASKTLFSKKTFFIHDDTGPLRRFVTSNTMEVISAVVIVVATLSLALEVQYHGFQIGLNLGYRWYSSTPHETWPFAETLFVVMDYLCGIALTLEVLLKAIALGKDVRQDGWNLLDLSVTICWYIELIGDSVLPVDQAFLRMARLARLFRMLKLAKKVQGFDSLYLMTTAIRGSAVSLGWSICLLGLFQIVVALCVNSILANWYLEDSKYPEEERLIVFQYWGSFSRAILTTFEITLADFPEPCRMLSEFYSEWFAVFFVAHKLTIGFAVIGVINGVFIQETFKVATTDDQLMIRQRQRVMKTTAHKMGRLFVAADESGDGKVDVEEFRATMQEPDVQTWMASMDLNVEDAGMVFELLDADGDGALTASELVEGVSRLMGDARNLDMLVLMRDQSRIMRLIEKDVLPQLDLMLGKSPGRRTDASQQLGPSRIASIVRGSCRSASP